MMSHTSLRCLVIGAVLCLALSGCRAPLMKHRTAPIVGLEGVPRELDKVTLPAYRVEPPDILSIDCLLQVPDENYRLHEGDTVMLTVLDTLPEEPIAGIFPIEAGGVIRLGFGYDQVTLLDSPSARHLRLSTVICESTFVSHRSVYRSDKPPVFIESRVNIASARMAQSLSGSMDR